MESGIYSILNEQNGKIYVGQSININQRWIKHLHRLRNNIHPNSHLQSAWNKYGESSFIFSPIEYCEKSKLNENEIWWIKYFDSTNREKGYNLDGGGKSGFTVSEETRKKRSDFMKGHKHSEETKNKLRLINTGKKLSDETKKKISDSLTGTDRQYNARHSISKSQNTTGFFRVSKIKNKDGFYYRYSYYDNGKRISITSKFIDKLKQKVLTRGLEWVEY